MDPALSQSGVEEGRLVAGVGPDQQDEVGLLHAGDLGVEQVINVNINYLLLCN